MRWSITGTTIRASARCSEITRSVCSGSNRRVRTSVDASGVERNMWAKPQAWKSGAAIIVVPSAWSGIRDSSPAAGASDPGLERFAPFGGPVVPEVRITVRPGSDGGGGLLWSLEAITSSSEGWAAAARSSTQARKARRPSHAASTTAANSWS